MTLLSVTRTFLAARSLCIHWDEEGETKGGGGSQSEKSEGRKTVIHWINK